jgi:mono/diheme cytochrome c family protein
MGSLLGVAVAAACYGCSSSNAPVPTIADAGGSSSSGGGSSSSGSGSGSSSGGSDAAAAPLTWTKVYADVIAPHCAGCHAPSLDGGTARGGFRVGMLDLSTIDAGFANLINIHAQGTSVPATGYDAAVVCDTLEAGAAGSIRVVPGDAGASLIDLKLNGFVTAPPCGAPMPEPAPGPGEIPDGGQAAAFAEITDWINQGALP